MFHALRCLHKYDQHGGESRRLMLNKGSINSTLLVITISSLFKVIVHSVQNDLASGKQTSGPNRQSATNPVRVSNSCFMGLLECQ